jgi:hypothetical protein
MTSINERIQEKDFLDKSKTEHVKESLGIELN